MNMAISVPKALFEHINEVRGDVSRSRFIQKILEEKLGVKCQEVKEVRRQK